MYKNRKYISQRKFLHYHFTTFWAASVCQLMGACICLVHGDQYLTKHYLFLVDKTLGQSDLKINQKIKF